MTTRQYRKGRLADALGREDADQESGDIMLAAAVRIQRADRARQEAADGFGDWWHAYGAALQAYPSETADEHALRVAQTAWTAALATVEARL